MDIKARHWFFITLALTIGGGGSLDVNAKNNDGKKPYDLCHERFKDTLEVAALLKPQS